MFERFKTKASIANYMLRALYYQFVIHPKMAKTLEFLSREFGVSFDPKDPTKHIHYLCADLRRIAVTCSYYESYQSVIHIYSNLSEEFISYYLVYNNIDFHCVSKFSVISENFIRCHCDMIDFKALLENENVEITEDFYKEFSRYFDLS